MKTRRVIGMGCAAMLGLSLLGSGTVNAAPAISFTNATTFAATSYSLGWEFTVLTNISVTHLGYYDMNSDGVNNRLLDNHPVGIFKTAGPTLVVSNTVLTTDTLVVGDGGKGYYVYHQLPTPVTLTAGTTYRIAGVSFSFSNQVPYTAFQPSLGSDPSLTLGAGYYASSVVLIYPTQTASGQFYAAPNFIFDVIPEPTTLALLAAGGLLLWRRRKS